MTDGGSIKYRGMNYFINHFKGGKMHKTLFVSKLYSFRPSLFASLDAIEY